MHQAADVVLNLEIVSAEGEVYSGDARMVVVPSSVGGMGIMPRHAPLLATLKPGEVRVVKPEGDDEYLYISGGYLEVQPENVTILADTAFRGEEVDEAAALASKRRAEKIIQSARLFVDRDRAQIELLKALAQLKALEHVRRRNKGGL
jgi:F-type H+-transporting ATPase subunit epsilon